MNFFFKRPLFLIIICTQLLIIFFLARNLYTKKHILGEVSTNPIQKNMVISSTSATLQYFYEPKPDSILKPEVIFPGLESVTYKINKDGLNQLINYSIEKTSGTYRIITIGDSYTFGQNLNTEDNYPSQLVNLLNENLSCPHIKNFEVLNLGVWGYDFQYTLERFRLRGKKYNPDLVIWLVISDDFRRVNESVTPKVRKYIQDAKKTGEYQKQLDKGLYYIQWEKALDETVAAMGGEEALQKFQTTQLQKITTYYSGPLLFLTYRNRILTKEKEILTEFSASRKNTYYFDQLPNIWSTSDSTLPDGHPNKTGYKRTVESLVQYLISNKVFNCSLK